VLVKVVVHFQVQLRILQRNRVHRDAIRALINAVEGSLQAAVGVLGDVEHEAQFSATRFKRSIPVAGDVLRGRKRRSPQGEQNRE